MALTQEVSRTFLARVDTQNIRLVTVAAVVPASGAPGAYKIAIADAALAVDYWYVGITIDTPSAAGLFDYDIATPAAGTTVLVGSHHFEVATDAGGYIQQIQVPIPIRIPFTAVNGLAIRQLTASGQTCNVVAMYMTGLGA